MMPHGPVEVGTSALIGLVALGSSRALAHASKAHAELVRSAAGGVSVAFVLVHLFVELAQGSAHKLYGIVQAGPEPVHTMGVVLLVGLLGMFIAAAVAEKRADARIRHAVALLPHLGYLAFVGAALVEEAEEGVVPLALFALAMSLHLGVVERSFLEHFPARHDARTSVLSWVTLVAGTIVSIVAEPSAGVLYLVLALVAGATLLSTFRDELPSPRDSRIGALILGAVAFTVLEQLRWWL